MIKLNSEILRFNNLISEISALYHEASVKLGISDSSMQILYTVCSSESDCIISDVCRMTGISKQTVNSSLRNMEKNGILYLEQCGGRKRIIRLTEKGQQLADKTARKLIEVENRIYAKWSTDDKEQYIALTKKYLKMFREELNGGDIE